MKYLIEKILFFTALLFVLSCNKKLDTIPTISVPSEDALKTSGDVLGALAGAYRDFGTASFFGGRVFLEGDLMAYGNEINWSGTYQGLTQINNNSIPVDNGFVSDIWLAGYRAINDVNNVLNALNVVAPT